MRNVDYSAVLSMLSRMHKAGRPLPFITIVGPDEIPVAAVKDASPKTIVVLRIWHPGDDTLDMGVQEYFRRYIDPVRDRWDADYHQPNNEVNTFTPQSIDWWRGAISLANSRGWKLACPTWSTGNPPDLNTWHRQDVCDLLRAIRNGGHLFGVHEYFRNDGDWDLGRLVKHVYPMLPDDLRTNMPKTAFTEWGELGARAWTTEQLKAKIAGWQQLLDYPWIVGAATWTVGDTGNDAAESWVGDNIRDKLTVFESL